MKPCLFNTDMVRAITEDRKTVTRRVVKPQPAGDGSKPEPLITRSGYWNTWGDDYVYRQPYRPGDILYVRETWCWCPCWDCGMDTEEGCVDEIAERFYNDQKAEWGCYGYKASFAPNEAPFDRWYPSIHMPREAARIFLRVTDVRVERLREITEEQAQAEGVKGWMVATDRDWDKNPNYILAFRHAWNSTIKTADRTLYGWEANPWVWVIEFERISRKEAEK